MSTDRLGFPRRWADIFVALVLLLAHGSLVLFTVLMSAGIGGEQEYLESRCRYHHLDCSNPGRSIGGPIAVGVSAILALLDLALVIWRSSKRRLSFSVPLPFCIGQFVVIVALYYVVNG